MKQRIAVLTQSKTRRAVAIAACLGGFALCPASAQRSNHVGTTVALVSGSCVSVQNGDTLTLDWNPAFENREGIVGMRHFEMAFARDEEAARGLRSGAPLTLIAAPRTHGELPGKVGAEIEASSNGYFHIRFHPDLQGIEPGEYHLVSAQAFAKTSSNVVGAEPAMTNSPVRYPFCIAVTAASGR